MTAAAECRDRALDWVTHDHRISAALIYGSLARGQFRPGSDIDIAAWGIDAGQWLNVVGLGLELGREVETNICLAESMRPEVRQAALRDGLDL